MKQRLWHGRVLRIATRPSIFTWTLFPMMYACTRLHWDLDMYFWEQIRPLDPLPPDYRQRFSNVQAAIALEGLAFLDEWSTRTQKHAERMSAVAADGARRAGAGRRRPIARTPSISTAPTCRNATASLTRA